MAITATQIQFRLSLPGTTMGNRGPQSDVNDSLGGHCSQTEITDASLNNLFDDVSGDDNAASDVEYRGFFVYNSNVSLPWQSVKMWISASVTGGALACISKDTTAVTTVGHSAASQMLLIPDEDTAPTALVFTAPETKAGGISLGTIAANSVHGIWIVRAARNSAALDNDGLTVSCEGDTAA